MHDYDEGQIMVTMRVRLSLKIRAKISMRVKPRREVTGDGEAEEGMYGS